MAKALLLLRQRAFIPRRRLFSTVNGSNSSSDGGVAVKHVTRANFWEALDDLKPLVRAADFVAVDLEMTGVTSAPWREPFEFDRADVRYRKLKDSATKFAVVQFGVCPFLWDPSTASFRAHPYNFYIFPRSELPCGGPSYEFQCQTSSMDFLAKYQFDFNVCIREGVSYLSRAQEEEALGSLHSALVDKSMGISNSHLEIPLKSTADLLFTERMKIKFHEWRADILKAPKDDLCSGGAYYDSKKQIQTAFFRMRPAILLSGFSSHQLKLAQLVVRKHFDDLVYVDTGDSSGTPCSHVVYVDSMKDKEELMKGAKEDQMQGYKDKVRNAVGFRHVIDLLTSEQKLVIGHNCILDIAHIYNKFFGPLPSTIEEFASSINKNFPYIIDTKHLLNSHALQYLMKTKSKSLSSAFSLLCRSASISPSYVKIETQSVEHGSSCYNSSAKHEAGYDAFMTGCVFAQACSYIGIKFELNQPSIDFIRNEKLQSYFNLLYPSWNSGTLINLSTGVECPDSSYKRKYPDTVFSNTALIWGFPSHIKAVDVKDCIAKTFGTESVVSIFFLDASAALVHFSKGELVADLLFLKGTLERDNGPISVLHPLSKLLEGGRTCIANYDTYSEICGSSPSRFLFANQAVATGINCRARGNPESLETKEVTSSNGSTALAPNAMTKQTVYTRRKRFHDITCEDMLESLSTSKILFRKGVST